MKIVSNNQKIIKYQYEDIKTILKKIIDQVNSQDSFNKTITVTRVNYQVKKLINRKKRLFKIYRSIDTKNRNYKESNGIETYSAKDIHKITLSLLKQDIEQTVSKKTLTRDIKLLEDMELIKRFNRKIRKNNRWLGTKSHYILNSRYKCIYKNVILEYLIYQIVNNLKNKRTKIVGEFDDIIENFKFKEIPMNETILDKYNEKEFDNSRQFIVQKNNSLKKGFKNANKINNKNTMSHVQTNPVFNKTVTNYSNKNSVKEFITTTIKNKKYNKSCISRSVYNTPANTNVRHRLKRKYKVKKRYIEKIRAFSNNERTFINALLNLETAIKEHNKNYYVTYITQHFLYRFRKQYSNKIWMMMKRNDNIISDYEFIWNEQFKNLYLSKSQLSDKNYKNKNLKFGG